MIEQNKIQQRIEEDIIDHVSVNTDKDTNEDLKFMIHYLSGKKLETKGKLTKETAELIRHLQSEVMRIWDMKYMISKEEVGKAIDEIMEKYEMKSSDGGFKIKAHIGFDELKQKLGIK